MPVFSANVRGILFTVVAAAAFVTNDTFLKAATAELPAMELLFLRSLFSVMWCIPLLVATGAWRGWRHLGDKWVLARNCAEVALVFCFIVALIHMPLADLSAVGQLSPVLVMVAAAVLFKEPLGWLRIVLIVLGFVGALMVVQPTGDGFSPYAVLGLGVAAGNAFRDLVSRNVPAQVPGLIVALGAALMVLVASLPVGLVLEDWTVPSNGTLLALAASGFFLTFGHLFIFLAYRNAPVGVVAPFLYSFTIWAVIAGFLAFGDLPNTLGLFGIALILASGVAIVLLAERKRRFGLAT